MPHRLKIERLKSRIANRRSRHQSTTQLERELVNTVVKQIRAECRSAKRERKAA